MTTFPVSENAEWVSVLSYTTALTAPFAIQAALKLNVFEILNRHGQLSAQQIIDLLPRPCTNPHAPALLDRLLHHLSSKSPSFPCPLLTASLSPTSSVILYSLLPPSQYFLKDANGVSVGECVSQQVLHFLDTFRHLDTVILDGGDGFQKEFGHHISHHIAEHTPKLVAAMASMTAVLMPQLLDAYDGFADVGTLVDVGGCTGYTLIHILDKYPDLQGINFDQPHIVTSGANHPRLTHVGGNMLEAIPQADAVFMMRILHDWEDDDCITILKNCKTALGNKHGKVVVVDFYIPDLMDGYVPRHNFDILMMSSHGSKMRTAAEYRIMGRQAGYTDVKIVCIVNEYSVMEFLL